MFFIQVAGEAVVLAFDEGDAISAW